MATATVHLYLKIYIFSLWSIYSMYLHLAIRFGIWAIIATICSTSEYWHKLQVTLDFVKLTWEKRSKRPLTNEGKPAIISYLHNKQQNLICSLFFSDKPFSFQILPLFLSLCNVKELQYVCSSLYIHHSTHSTMHLWGMINEWAICHHSKWTLWAC